MRFSQIAVVGSSAVVKSDTPRSALD